MRQRLDDAVVWGLKIVSKLKFAATTLTLAGAATLDADAVLYNLDPGGATRVITLPAVEEGLAILINNIADAAEDLTINAPPATTIGTVSQNEMGIAICLGGVWYLRLVGANT